MQFKRTMIAVAATALAIASPSAAYACSDPNCEGAYYQSLSSTLAQIEASIRTLLAADKGLSMLTSLYP